MNKNLVVVRAGNNSLHRKWIDYENLNFDLIITYYGDNIPNDWVLDKYPIIKIKGSKWEGLYSYFKNNNEWKNYDYIFVPDDDLLFTGRQLNKFFEIVNKLKCDLSQPALDELSYFSFPITIVNRANIYRVTNFVEVMCPCFSLNFLNKTVELFKESKSGWGMDFYWTNLLQQDRLNPPIIVDEISIRHTRPVGSVGHGGANDPKFEFDEFIKKYEFKVVTPQNKLAVLNKNKIIGKLGNKFSVKVQLLKVAILIRIQKTRLILLKLKHKLRNFNK